jgi:hypothetical protein
LLIFGEVGCHESLVQSELPLPGKNARLHGTGWPQVGLINLHCGAPELYLGDQVSRRLAMPFHHPDLGSDLAGRSDLISEIDDQSGSGG